VFINFKYIKLLLATLFVVVVSSPAQAQTNLLSDDNIARAAEISDILARENLLTNQLTSLEQLQLSQYPPEMQLRHLRQHAHDTFTLSNTLNASVVLAEYRALVESIGTDRDRQVFDIYESLLTDFNPDRVPTSETVNINLLNEAAKSEDWHVANTALLLKSVLSSFQKNQLNIALEKAQHAQSLIPDEISPYVTDAKILTLSSITTINNLMVDPGMAIENTVAAKVCKTFK